MDHFTIKDIENLCGIKAHTLRIWEQRYKIFTPKRKNSLHRIYDSDDLKELLRISFLYHHGYKISKIAKLSSLQIEEEVGNIIPEPCKYELFVHQLIEAGIMLDTQNFEKIINDILPHIGLDKCIINVFYPFLQRVGLLWMTNHLIPAQEHFSSNIIRKKIIYATDGLEVNQEGETNVVIFSPPGEMHEIPLLFVNYLMKKKGIRTTYFGINVSNDTLQYFFRHQKISHLYTHLITHLDSAGMNNFICTLCNSFPEIPIVLSGPAGISVRQQPANLCRLQSMDEVNEFILSLSKPD